jgi:lysophospholipid acyltransferase (LPLAT)-like uncharacterized protein
MMLRLLPWAATLLARTLRIRWHGDLPTRAIVMFWHGKMFAGWIAARKHKPIALVSKSKDGAILSSVLSHWGYQLSRGSTKKGGMEALEEAIERIKNAKVDTLAITPDGPTGPQHLFKRGGFIAARESELPLVMLSIRYRNRIQLKSWDKFEVPLPFSRVDIDVKDIPLPESLDDETLATLSRRFDA